MKTNYLLLIIATTLIISCNHKQKVYDYDRIELIEYRIYTGNNNTLELVCKFFARIDSNGQCKLMENYTGVTHLKNFKIPDTLLLSLVDRLSSFKKDIDLHPNKPMLYDGSYLRIVYYAKGVKRTIDFIEDPNYSDAISMRLFKYIQKLNKEPEYLTFTDTAAIRNSRIKQLETIYDNILNGTKKPDSIRSIK